MTVLVGIAYPFAMFAVGRIISGTSNGSYVTNASGGVVGSALIGQSFKGAKWFWPRPSAAGDGYDALSSGGTNLAADNPELVQAVADRKAALLAANGVTPDVVPADAVTASGSGLDPDISPQYAHQQVARVAAARGLDSALVSGLVDNATQGRFLGFIGEPRVNVLQLNLALENVG
jgi:K+-transporting ATPase ATPase C chain